MVSRRLEFNDGVPPPYLPPPQYQAPEHDIFHPAMATPSSQCRGWLSFLLTSVLGFSKPTEPMDPTEYRVPDLELLRGPPTSRVVTKLDEWNELLSTPENPLDVVVRSVTHSKSLVEEYQHEFLRLELYNQSTSSNLVVISQRNITPDGTTMWSGMASDELIFVPEDDTSAPCSVPLQTIRWPLGASPNICMVFDILHFTSQVCGPHYHAFSWNCYRFARIASLSLRKFQRKPAPYISDHSFSFKMSKFILIPFFDSLAVERSVVDVMVKYFDRQ